MDVKFDKTAIRKLLYLQYKVSGSHCIYLPTA